MNDAKVIESLGGHIAVSQWLSENAAKLHVLPVSIEAALLWTKRAIPWGYRKPIKRLARVKRVTIPRDFLHTRRPAP